MTEINYNEMLGFNGDNEREEDKENGIKGIPTIDPIPKLNEQNNIIQNGNTSVGASTSRTKVGTEASATAVTNAQNQAQLDYVTGVEHVTDDKVTEDYVSTRQLYERQLGVTEYDELRAKLHLRDDESFTDYYNRTHYVPKGYEMQAKLLLAEEKRKKLYAEVEAGNMSEEDFLYEAYGKDLLKQEGIDFESPLYWYQRYKAKDYTDPRDNTLFLAQLIEEAREIFQNEKWHEEKVISQLDNTLAGYVTGEVLSTDVIADIFADQFEVLTEYYDSKADIVKYYRAGLLQGFNPTIDVNGDGKIDYYLAPNGKLYNVNETGQGANTYKAYYNDDGSLNRIVASDSVAGEITGSLLKSVGRFFTDVIDFGALIIGTVVDIFDTKPFGETIGNYAAEMGKFWNTSILADTDYIADTGWSAGEDNSETNWAVIGREAAGFIGTVAGFIATLGGGAILKAGSKAATTGAKAATSAIGAASATAAASATKKLAVDAIKTIGKDLPKKTIGQKIGSGAKAAGTLVLDTAVKLTSWANGAFTSSSFMARTGSILTTSVRDTLQSVAIMSINQEQLGLSDSEVVSSALTGGVINFATGMAFRSMLDQGAINIWAKTIFQKRVKQNIAGEKMEELASTLSAKITNGLLTGRGQLSLGIANTAMDLTENIISAWVQTSLATSGEVFNADAFKMLFDNPEFIFNLGFQAKNTLTDQFKINKRKLLGSIADAKRMDTDFNMYLDAHIQKAKDNENITALKNLRLEYNQTIKNNIDNGMTKAEAIITALESVTNKLDLDADNPLITTWRNRIKENIKQEYFAQNKVVFNRLKQIGDTYNKILEESKNGRFYKLIFNKELKLLNDGYIKLVDKYININIDERMRESLLGLQHHYSDIFGSELDKIDFPENEEFKVKAMLGKVAAEVLPSGETQYKIGDSILKDFTPEEFANYNTYIESTDDTQYRPLDILIDLTTQNVDSIDGKRNEEAKRLAAAAYDQYTAEYNLFNTGETKQLPTFIKLSNNRYIIRYHGEANTQLLLADIFGVIKAIANIKAKTAGSNSKLELANSIELLFKVFDKNATKDTPYVLKDNKDSIPGLIDTLIKNKILTYTQAAKVLSTIKAQLGNELLPTGFLDNKRINDEYIKVTELLPFMESLTEVREAQNRIANGKGTEKDTVAIRSFASQYLNFDPDDWKSTASTILKTANDEFLISVPEMKQIQKLGFLTGLPESLARTAGFKNFMTALLSKDNDSEYKQISDTVLDTLLNISPNLKYDKATQTIGTIKDFIIETVPPEDRKAFYKTLGKKTDLATTIDPTAIAASINNMQGKQNKKTKKHHFNKYKQKLQQYIKDVPLRLLQAYMPKATPEELEKYLKEYIEYAKQKHKSETTNTETPKTNIILEDFNQLKEWAENRFKDAYLSPINKAIRKGLVTVDELQKLSKAKICEGDCKIFINFNYLLGAEHVKLQDKLARPKIQQDIARASSSEIMNILFTTSEAEYKYRQESQSKEKYLSIYSDNNAVHEFNLANPNDKQELAQILKDFNYNLNGDMLYKDSKIIIPGVYTNPSMFEGVVLKSATGYSIIEQLERKLSNEYNKVIPEKDIINDPLAAIESWASGIQYITDDTTLEAKNIVMNFLDADFTLSDGYTSIISDIEAKLGKNAGALVKAIVTNYSATIATSKANIQTKKTLFVHYLINALGDMYEDLSKGSLHLTNITTTLPNKDMVEKLSTLYNVEKKTGTKDTYIISLKDWTKEKFVEKAHQMLDEGKISGIEILVPYFNNGDTNRHNTLLRPGLSNASQTILGDSILTYVDGKLRSFFDQTFVTNCLIPTKPEHAIDFSSIKNISPKKFDEAIAAMDKKKVADILGLDSTNNPFIAIQQAAIKASKALSERLLAAIKDIDIDNKKLSDEAVTKVLSTLGNSDARRYISMAIHQARKYLQFDKNNKLIVSKQLSDIIAKILEDMPKLSTAPRKQESDLNPYISKDTGAYVSGQQLTGLNPKQLSPDYSSETINAILQIIGMSKRDIVKKFSIKENLLEEFITILKASSNKNAEVLPLKYLYSFTPKEFIQLRKDLTNIIDNTTLNNIEKTINYIYNNSELINKYENLDYPTRLYQAERFGPSYHSVNTAIIEVSNKDEQPTTNIAEHFIYTRLVNPEDNVFYKKSLRQKHYLKLSSIDDPIYRDNILLQEFAKKLFNQVVPITKNKGSIVLQNLNIIDNLGTLHKSISNLAYTLQKNIEGLKSVDACNLAFAVYLTSTGMEYQAVYPEYLIYDKKLKQVVNFAMSGSYSDKEDTLMATIYRDHFVKNETTGQYELATDDLIVLKTDRNAFNSLYSEAIGDITIIDLGLNKSKIEDIYKQRIEYIKQKAHKRQPTALKTLSNEEVHKLVCDEMFNILERGSYTTTFNINKKGKDLFIGDTLNNIINDREGLSYTKITRSDFEELIYNIREPETTLENKKVINSKIQKLRDALAYGLDYEEFAKHPTIINKLKDNSKALTAKIKTRFKNPTVRKQVLSTLEELTDAINHGDEFKTKAYIENLKRIYSNRQDKLISDIISFYIANTDTMDMAILRLFDAKDLYSTLEAIDKSATKIKIDDTEYTLKELLSKPKLIIDIEVLFGNKNGLSDHIYQISITYIDSKGNIHEPVTFYNKVKDIQTMKSIEAFEGFTNKYLGFEGTKQSINAYLASDGTMPQKFLDTLKLANSEGALLIGYNSEKFDLPKLMELNNPVFKLEDFKALVPRHIDAYKFVEEFPTYANISKRGGGLKLGALAKQLLSHINIDETHNAEIDTYLTAQVFTELLQKTITSNEFKYMGALDIIQLYKFITGKDLLSSTQVSMFDIDTINSLINPILKDFKVADEDTDFVNNIKSLRDTEDRIIKTYDIVQELEEKRAKDYFDILERAWRKEFIGSRSPEKRAFAEIYSHKRNADFLNLLISFKLKDIATDTGKAKELARMTKVLCQSTNTSLDNLAKALTQPKDVILHLLNISPEEFKAFEDSPTYSAEGFLNTNFYKRVDKDTGELISVDLLQEHSIRSAANSLVYATSDLYKQIQELPVDKQLKDFLLQELYTYYDANADKPYKAHLEPNQFIDLIAKLDKEQFNYFLTDPITNQSYQAIYRLAQTVSNNTIMSEGKQIYLDNDVIALDYQNICDLFGLDPNTNISISDIKKSLGIKDTEDIMLPVIRHPLDKRDSFHFFRVKILDNDPYNAGIRCAINIDSILAKLNGDLDGDHLSILRPNIYLQKYANTVNKYKNLPMSLLDKTLAAINTNANIIDIKEINLRQNIERDSFIIMQIENDLMALNNYTTDSNLTIQEVYTQYLNSFIEDFEFLYQDKLSEIYLAQELKRLNKSQEELTDEELLAIENIISTKIKTVAKEIYIQPPIDVSTKISNTHRFAFYSDCAGLLGSILNQQGKRLYQLAQISDHGVLRYTDSVTGMRQKEYLTEDLQLIDINWVDNIIRLSPTTRTLINNNIDEVKTKLAEIITKYELPKRVITNALKKLNMTYTLDPSFSVQQTLVFLQEETQKLNKPIINKAINDLKQETKDTPFGKFYNTFIANDTADEIYNYSDIFRIKNNIESKLFSSSSSSNIADIIKVLAEKRSNNSSITVEQAAAQPQSHDIFDYKWVLYKNPEDRIIAEDTYLTLPAINSQQAVRIDEIYLNQKDIQYFRKKYTPQSIISDKDLKHLGLKYNTQEEIRFIASGDDSIGITRAVPLASQKLGTVGIGGSKGTASGHLSDIDPAYQDCIIQRPYAFATKKMTSDITKLAKTFKFFNANNELIGETNDMNGRIPEGTVAIMALEPLAILEASGLTSQSAKDTKLDIAAYGNNLDSTGGAFLVCGQMYKYNAQTKTVDLDNSKYRNMMAQIEEINMPDRYEHNAMPLYNILVLSTALKYADLNKLQKIYPDIVSVTDLINKLIKTHGIGLRLLNEVARIGTTINTENINDFDKAILSTELFNTVYNRRLAVAPDYIENPISSKNKAYEEQMDTSHWESIFSITGDMAQMADGTIGEDAYVSMREFQNKLLSLSKINTRVSKSSIQTLEANDFLNKGLATKRTQINPFPHNQALSKDYSINKEASTTMVKRGEQAGNAQATYSNITGIIPTDSKDFDYTKLYSRSNYILNRNGSRFLELYGKGKELSYSADFPNTITALRLALLSQSINKVDATSDRDTEFQILSNLDPRRNQTELSIAEPKYQYDSRGVIHAKTNRQYKGVVDSPGVYNILRQARTSPQYFRRKEQFEQEHMDKLDTLIASDTTPKDLTKEDLNEGIKKSYDIYLGRDSENAAYAEQQQKYIQDMQNFKDFTEQQEVQDWAQKQFYAGTIDGEHKQFQTTKLSMNQSIKLKDGWDLKVDRVIKNFTTEAMAISQDLSVDYINLANEVKNTNNFEMFNTFAYVLGLWDRKRQANAVYNKTKQPIYKEIMTGIDKSIQELGIKDVDAFIKDFELKHSKQAALLYSLVQKIQVQAQKYSNLCNEPGQNIFFILSPSVKNTNTDKTTAAKYMTSMLLHNTDVSDGHVTYASYNILSSMSDTITQISRQAAIYNNAQRLKEYGLMENISTQEILYSIYNSEEVQKVITESTKYISNKKEQELKTALELYLLTATSSDNIIDENLKETLDEIFNQVFPDDTTEPLSIPKAYIAIFNALNKAIHETGFSLEQALAEVNTKHYSVAAPEAKMVIAIYNSMSDIFSQLSYFTDDTLATTIANKIKQSVGTSKALVDQYGRPALPEDDSIYKLSDVSLQHMHDSVDAYFNKDRWLITKTLKGELYTMDRNLSIALANNVFIKENAKGFKKALQKTSSWCVKFIMASPFKLLDRLAKFTAFDTTTLSSANAKTLLKSGEAMSDLRAYFASKGTVQTDNLAEFLYATGYNLSADNFNLIMNNFDAEDFKFNPIKKYTDATGKLFTIQSMFQRYAYWLATKEALSTKTKTGETKTPDYSVLGSAYYLRDAIKDLDGITSDELSYDSYGNPIKQTKQKVSKEGQQAAFAMSQILGSPGDFPNISKQLGKYGMVFTTFILAAMRWGIGEIRSLGSAFKNLFTEGSRLEGIKWLTNNGGGILGTYIISNLLISLICDMFGVDEEQEEEWQNEQALPNIAQTLINGTPVMDTYNSANITHELKDLLVTPFISQEGDTVLSGLERFIYKNVVGHINPLTKNMVETITGQDYIDNTIIDTKDQYSMWENVFRKLSGYIIGASGANALTKELANEDATLLSGLKAAVSAEVGNTKAYKSNLRNYYKVLDLINAYNYKDSDNNIKYSTYNSFNTSNYNAIKSDIYSKINKGTKITDVYSLIIDYYESGISLYEIKSAMRTCSIQNKLESMPDLGDFLASISPNDFQNVKTALAFEQTIYPWLDEGEKYVNALINDANSYSSNYLNINEYRPSGYTTYYRQPTYSNYFTSSNNTYRNYNYDPIKQYFSTLWDSMYSNTEEN